MKLKNFLRAWRRTTTPDEISPADPRAPYQFVPADFFIYVTHAANGTVLVMRDAEDSMSIGHVPSVTRIVPQGDNLVEHINAMFVEYRLSSKGKK